ncbi:hypothetical protein M2192_007553 [Bradyrhizobium elkanii USDA 61]|jgi:hypothetical protein|uniref:Uncharacterized protein n=1 Tax=Bradyrhizobium elkanii TaxID=29448 RepID=A0A8I1Y4X8_BRAEL|nr:hypothetical protein [Bradyrhizobium elkanii]MCS4010593.1 hypothetical protein [Bradyrhizobium elkanii USDA 61]MCP1925938.1 hypothetical protein [Bradyrhizobium elkanii]MCS3451499.1 hypothetical protein [Bradyrhizobium elkanii]MCS3476569.1 hypothetical protein [Bradyrhizobium elkanii]
MTLYEHFPADIREVVAFNYPQMLDSIAVALIEKS